MDHIFFIHLPLHTTLFKAEEQVCKCLDNIPLGAICMVTLLLKQWARVIFSWCLRETEIRAMNGMSWPQGLRPESNRWVKLLGPERYFQVLPEYGSPGSLPRCTERPALEEKSAFQMPLIVEHRHALGKLSSMNHIYAYRHTYLPYYLNFHYETCSGLKNTNIFRWKYKDIILK